MPRCIAKFGGTSVGTADAIRRLPAILADTSIIGIVVSAMAGATDLLAEFCENGYSGAEKIINKHINVANELGLDIAEDIKRIASRLHETKDTANILALGEDLSCFIVHSYLVSVKIDVTRLDARNYIIADTISGYATTDKSSLRLKSWPDKLFIIQGFIGSTPDGHTTTLGRGSSDYSASLVAEYVAADELWIYTDVCGVHTADPNVIADARPIRNLSFREMYEVANNGAKVLHPKALDPCKRMGITIRILSTFNPQDEGTTITQHDCKKARVITVSPEQMRIVIDCFAVQLQPKILEISRNNNMRILSATESEVICNGHRKYLSDLLQDLGSCVRTKIYNDLTLLSVMGDVDVAFLNSSTINAVYSTDISTYIFIEKEKAIDVARFLHNQLINSSFEDLAIQENL